MTAHSSALESLATLRRLLRREYLTGSDLHLSLAETAMMAREALSARLAFVGLWDSDRKVWTAYREDGETLEQEEIRLVGSVSVLEAIRVSGRPLMTNDLAPELSTSSSARQHSIRRVLGVPLRWYGPAEGVAESARFAGALVADRTASDPEFSTEHIELVTDLARIAERTLNALRHLGRVKETVSHLEMEVAEAREVAGDAARSELFETRDARFADRVLAPLARAARADKVGVLMLGPTGSGKTHLAHAFHYASRRRDGPFVTLDCGQVTSTEALGAELFGYARRSGFSVPPEGRLGRARLAHGGTLFLDEIATLPMELQPRLLRLIQFGRFSALGSAEEESVDVQVVAAANQDLRELVREGRFREDLYWRLAEITIELPSLSERPADIERLASHFLAAARERFGRAEILGLSAEAVESLVSLDWSRAGNVRGLEQAIHRSVLVAPEGLTHLGSEHLQLPEADLHTGSRRGTPASSFEEARAAKNEGLAAFLVEKLRAHQGVLSHVAADPEVARAFGLSAPPVPASTLRVRLTRLGLGGELIAARRSLEKTREEICRALKAHGGLQAAASSLGLSRDQLAWRLRKEGLTVRDVLDEPLP